MLLCQKNKLNIKANILMNFLSARVGCLWLHSLIYDYLYKSLYIHIEGILIILMWYVTSLSLCVLYAILYLFKWNVLRVFKCFFIFDMDKFGVQLFIVCRANTCRVQPMIEVQPIGELDRWCH